MMEGRLTSSSRRAMWYACGANRGVFRVFIVFLPVQAEQQCLEASVCCGEYFFFFNFVNSCSRLLVIVLFGLRF